MSVFFLNQLKEASSARRRAGRSYRPVEMKTSRLAGLFFGGGMYVPCHHRAMRVLSFPNNPMIGSYQPDGRKVGVTKASAPKQRAARNAA